MIAHDGTRIVLEFKRHASTLVVVVDRLVEEVYVGVLQTQIVRMVCFQKGCIIWRAASYFVRA